MRQYRNAVRDPSRDSLINCDRSRPSAFSDASSQMSDRSHQPSARSKRNQLVRPEGIERRQLPRHVDSLAIGSQGRPVASKLSSSLLHMLWN